LHANELITRDRLIDAVWGQTAPPTAPSIVHGYVRKIRAAIDGTGAQVITRGGGYVLEVLAESIDAKRFERLANDGRRALAVGDADHAQRLLTEALALWRGDPFADLIYEPAFEIEAHRLEDLRLEAKMDRIDAELSLDTGAGLTVELEALVSRHPFVERLWGQLMVALYRIGRQADALNAYRRATAALADQLGIDPGPNLERLERAILRQDPSLETGRPSQRPKTNLPAAPTRFIGRERELIEARALLSANRLLTLIGPGGSGKSRLALQLAAETPEDFPDGVFWVPLHALGDASLVERAVATSLGIDGNVVDHLRDKSVLLILDNFEQVIDAALTVSALLGATPNVKIIVTSRERLRVGFEQLYPVDPLPEDDARALFMERARAVVPSFRYTEAVDEICRRVDNLPLAIELAAARVLLFDPADLLARLGRRLELLGSGPRDAPARHQTLRAAIEWSYRLLPPDEQRLFRSLAVFAGSFTVDSARIVCGANLEDLESLLLKSLLRRADTGRLAMLDTIREYALEFLDESDDAEAVRLRHAEFFLGVALSANLNAGILASGGQHLDIAIAEQHDLRAALGWALERGLVELGLQLAVAMDMFWTSHDPREGMRWLGALLSYPQQESVPPALRAHALRSYGSSTQIAGDEATAERLWEESLDSFGRLHDEHGSAVLLHRLGISAMHRGDLERAQELVDASSSMHERNPVATERAWGLAQSTGTQGAIARDSGHDQDAFELIRRSAALGREVGVSWWVAGMLAELACLSLKAGRVGEAERFGQESLTLADEAGDPAGRVFGVGVLARVAFEQGDLRRAGRLWGAIEDEDGVAPPGGWRHHRQVFAAHMQLDSPAFRHGRTEGRALTLDRGVSLARLASSRFASPDSAMP